MEDYKEINFIDLSKQRSAIHEKLIQSINNVLENGAYVLGPEVKKLEGELSEFCQVKNTITCGNGTDALLLTLLSYKVKESDIVFVPSFSFTSVAEVVCLAGATPYFIDVDKKNFNIKVEDLKRSINDAKRNGSKPKAVISVDLFGCPADYESLENICAENDLILIIDAAQSFGAEYNNKKIGSYGNVTTTSFFPAKPLGCYGDGGAIFTTDDEIAELLRSLRVHGKGQDKYDNVNVGMNSRLDTIQAAILLTKLSIFPEEIVARNNIAKRYNHELEKIVEIPLIPDESKSVWAQYTIRVKEEMRDKTSEELAKVGVPTAIYYPKPLHLQTAYISYPRSKKGLNNSEDLSRTCLSLPMHPYLDESTQDYIIENIKRIIT